MISLHFFGHQPDDSTIALAQALGVGSREDTRNAAEVGKFEQLLAEAPKHWRVAPLEEADVVILSVAYEGNSESMPEVARARELGKPVLYFNPRDNVAPLPAHYGTLYRDSFEAHTRLPHEEAMPAFSKDFYAEGREFAPREKQSQPVVGFCGFVGTAWSRLLYHLQRRKQKVLGLELRHRALRVLERTSGVKTNFICRSQFWGGTVSRRGAAEPQSVLQVRNEYLDNIIDSDYTLCVRGAGNFSYRFYETLSLGRIPLFINTDCVLPFADAIDWRKHCVWVESYEIPQIGEIVRQFHDQLAPQEFVALQHANRQLWQDYLRPLECYQHILHRTLAS
ncbi:exostosin domain-containing protein [Aeoliella sp. SH292]|uniref:exostosin domain-containing protein n=1 Tax=Aeoliella sp. SH292 TaxID=3454464 RepID=UPI003F98F7BB